MSLPTKMHISTENSIPWLKLTSLTDHRNLPCPWTTFMASTVSSLCFLKVILRFLRGKNQENTNWKIMNIRCISYKLFWLSYSEAVHTEEWQISWGERELKTHETSWDKVFNNEVWRIRVTESITAVLDLDGLNHFKEEILH